VIFYNKAARDGIPEIIRAGGKACRVEVLDQERWLEELKRKLSEELQEYLESGDLEELADIVEVVYGIAAALGETVEELERLRLRKREARGGFDERLFLVSVE